MKTMPAETKFRNFFRIEFSSFNPDELVGKSEGCGCCKNEVPLTPEALREHIEDLEANLRIAKAHLAAFTAAPGSEKQCPRGCVNGWIFEGRELGLRHCPECQS